MRKLTLAILAVLLMLGAASANGATTVTYITGTPASGITLTGSGFGAGPSWVYFETFERSANVTAIDSTATGNQTALYAYGDSAYTRYWMAQRFDAGNYHQITDDRAFLGSRSMNVCMKRGKTGSGDLGVDAPFSLGGLNENLKKSKQSELFIQAQYYDLCDTASINDLHTAGRSLVKVVGVAAAGDVYLGKITRAAWPDSSFAFREAYGATPTYVSRALKGKLYKRWELLANNWHRLGLWLKGESSASASDGRMFAYLDGAAVDTSRARDFGTETSPWMQVLFNHWWAAADSFTTATAFFDDIYMASSPRRVEIGDKITYGNCTKLYVQMPTYWSADGDSIQFVPYVGTIAATATKYIFVIGANNSVVGGGIVTAASTALDSLVATAPSISVASDSTAFIVNGAYSLAFDNDSDDGNKLGYLATSSVTINWGDGKTTTGATSPATHTYQREGRYRVSISGTSWAGTGALYLDLYVYDLPTADDAFPFGSLALADATYSATKKKIDYPARWWRVASPGAVTTVSMWNCTAGDGCRQVFPFDYGRGGATADGDSLYTVLRGMDSGIIDLGDAAQNRANVIIYRTDGSTTPQIEWR